MLVEKESHQGYDHAFYEVEGYNGQKHEALNACDVFIDGSSHSDDGIHSSEESRIGGKKNESI